MWSLSSLPSLCQLLQPGPVPQAPCDYAGPHPSLPSENSTPHPGLLAAPSAPLSSGHLWSEAPPCLESYSESVQASPQMLPISDVFMFSFPMAEPLPPHTPAGDSDSSSTLVLALTQDRRDAQSHSCSSALLETLQGDPQLDKDYLQKPIAISIIPMMRNLKLSH